VINLYNLSGELAGLTGANRPIRLRLATSNGVVDDLFDTPGQISAQLESADCHSQLNLGYLTHPRCDGKADARGEGFELTTNDSCTIRTTKSLLISAWKRLDACGSQLSSEEHLDLMQDCLDLLKSLGKCAAKHKALDVDPAPQAELKDDMSAAPTGSNTAPGGEGGKPTLSVTAPADIAFTTPKTMAGYAGVNVDTGSMKHMQLTSGGRFNMNDGKGISVFLHLDGISHIAHNCKFLMQSHHGDMQIDSAKDIKATAGKRPIIMAEDEVTLMIRGGAYLTLKRANVEVGGPGPKRIKTDGHHWNGQARASTELPRFGAGDFGRVKPVEGVKVFIDRAGESLNNGVTDGDGKAAKIVSYLLQRISAIFYCPAK
jgi:type VI secretion system secreted protein VgrG